jgi:hypothetical protein
MFRHSLSARCGSPSQIKLLKGARLCFGCSLVAHGLGKCAGKQEVDISGDAHIECPDIQTENSVHCRLGPSSVTRMAGARKITGDGKSEFYFGDVRYFAFTKVACLPWVQRVLNSRSTCKDRDCLLASGIFEFWLDIMIAGAHRINLGFPELSAVRRQICLSNFFQLPLKLELFNLRFLGAIFTCHKTASPCRNRTRYFAPFHSGCNCTTIIKILKSH